MSQPKSPFTGGAAPSYINPFRVSATGTSPVATTNSNVYASPVNSSYFQYGGFSAGDQWMAANPAAYFYNSWQYPQPPNTPPSMLLQSPPLPPAPHSLGHSFSPGLPQPPLPPLPQEAVAQKPPPPPEKSHRRGRSVYPRGGRGSRGGTSRQQQPGSSIGSNLTDSNATQSTNGDGDMANSPTSITEALHQIQVHKKPKRKPMSSRYTRKRVWCREDAEKVVALENEMSAPGPTVFIQFPDQELNSHMVKGFSSDIESVHFQIPYKARSCCVRLRQGSDIKKVCQELSKVPFGTGFLKAEQKRSRPQPKPINAEGIDPYTLYVGNLPSNITVAEVKVNFPTAAFIDVGFAQRMKYTRYAFIQYNKVEDAMEAYKKTLNLVIDKRNLIVRFRRTKGNIALPTETQMPNAKKAKVDEEDCLIVSSTLKKINSQNQAMDSKENVLEEAARMMKNNTDKSGNEPDRTGENGPIVNIKSEKEDDAENDYADYVDLLGSQIKDEPDYFYSDDSRELHDDYDEEIPHDEIFDSMAAVDDYHSCNDEREVSENGTVTPSREREREKEFEEKEEKPDIETLPIHTDCNVDDFRMPRMRYHDVAPTKKDDLDDLFNAMNPESDDDDF